MGRDTIQREDAVSTISQDYLLEFTSKYGIPEDLHPELPGLEDTIVDFPEGKVDERIFPTVVDWRTSAAKDGMPLAGSYFAVNIAALNTNRMEDTIVALGYLRTPSTKEKSPLDFDNENPTPSTTEGVGARDQAQDGLAHEVPSVETTTTTEVVQERVLEKEVAAMGPPVNKRRRQREAGLTVTPVAPETSAGAKSVSDPDLLSYARPPPHSEQDVAQSSKGMAIEILPQYVATTEVNVQLSVGSLDSGKLTSVLSMDGSPGGGDGFSTQAKIRTRSQVVEGSQSQDSQMRSENPNMKKVAEAKNADLAKELESLRT
ncbi:hypothetical protein Tco_0924792 [Tanacetum coccineum]|uniref:Uncharacterized protein n=1 Tax=Tanacetum coccineum TaxID=301880 RepID=A0ABQ5D5U1_9ASTR